MQNNNSNYGNSNFSSNNNNNNSNNTVSQTSNVPSGGSEAQFIINSIRLLMNEKFEELKKNNALRDEKLEELKKSNTFMQQRQVELERDLNNSIINISADVKTLRAEVAETKKENTDTAQLNLMSIEFKNMSDQFQEFKMNLMAEKKEKMIRRCKYLLTDSNNFQIKVNDHINEMNKKIPILETNMKLFFANKHLAQVSHSILISQLLDLQLLIERITREIDEKTKELENKEESIQETITVGKCGDEFNQYLIKKREEIQNNINLINLQKKEITNTQAKIDLLEANKFRFFLHKKINLNEDTIKDIIEMSLNPKKIKDHRSRYYLQWNSSYSKDESKNSDKIEKIDNHIRSVLKIMEEYHLEYGKLFERICNVIVKTLVHPQRHHCEYIKNEENFMIEKMIKQTNDNFKNETVEIMIIICIYLYQNINFWANILALSEGSIQRRILHCLYQMSITIYSIFDVEFIIKNFVNCTSCKNWVNELVKSDKFMVVIGYMTEEQHWVIYFNQKKLNSDLITSDAILADIFWKYKSLPVKENFSKTADLLNDYWVKGHIIELLKFNELTDLPNDLPRMVSEKVMKIIDNENCKKILENYTDVKFNKVAACSVSANRYSLQSYPDAIISDDNCVGEKNGIKK